MQLTPLANKMTNLARLVSTVVEVMGNTFPELKQHEEKIKEIIAEEELSFGRTLIKVCNCADLDVMVWLGWVGGIIVNCDI
jgi:alanyl-tRNA synthetase